MSDTPTSRGVGGHHRPHKGHSDDWLTPPSLIEALGPFDYDPCASVDQPWRTALTQDTVDTGGLNREWSGLVWLNPPYGPQTGKWMERLADHGSGLALIFARTETKDFHAQVWNRASGLYFFAGRLHFHRPVTGERMKANSGAPSVLVAYGDEAVGRFDRLAGTAYPGKVVVL